MSSRPQPEEIRLVAEKISRYLETRPNAFDSIDGILRWWLLKQQVEEATEVVQAAMDYLVSSGAVEQVQSRGKTFYASARRDSHDDPDNTSNTTS